MVIVSPAENFSETESQSMANIDSNNLAADAEMIARRHSLSLLNRTPTKGSVASELLELTPRHNLQNAANIVNQIKESISDFGSCVEFSDGSCSQESLNETDHDSKNIFKKVKKKKRKKSTPDKECSVKKPNIAQSAELAKVNLSPSS